MVATALLVGLHIHQADACRCALGEQRRVLSALDARDALSLLSLHRARLVVVRTDLSLEHRKLIAELADRVGARVISVRPDATPATVERLVEGAASLAYADEGEGEVGPRTTVSGTRARVSPGQYFIARKDGSGRE